MTAPPPYLLSPGDLYRLRDHGMQPAEADRQIALLQNPPPSIVLHRPCTVGDGIERIETEALADLHARHDRAAIAGELSAFVPASGAASRMFRDLIAYRDDPRMLTREELLSDRDAGHAGAPAVLEFAEKLSRFAFYEPLRLAVRRRGASLDMLEPRGPYRPVIAALLDDDGLGYAKLPKGLVTFHAYGEETRTAFEEHLSEAIELYRDAEGRARVHATVAEHDLGRFEAVLASARQRLEERHGARLDVEFSVQDPATDTLALDADGQPFRDASGEIVLRPAGHGALVRNLSSVPTPIALIKNVDNVAAGPFREPTRVWVRALIGRLLELRESGTRADDRPLRVCGVVPNTGEPGGGPFWVLDAHGNTTRQIVESAQVRMDDLEQRAVWSRATHFNPVLMACLFEDSRGRRHRLDRFVDQKTSIVTRRSAGARELVVLERPGLWNGGMAGWDTVFVEVPLGVFTPVKTVNDLLREEHQATR